ncbi:MAG TPA: LytTR family DNA-binding domain-containing protein, partial [Bacteroidia bacterium]|nr:LytTR family DNA-binding domain-containing protein [Bacteroidia bacterium]
MKALIIEDELPAADRLANLLNSIDDTIEIVGSIPSIEKAMQWFGNNDFPDIIFMDIELSDGRCFEIFNRIQISAPVIFTTAYDQFAINAIKLNALDYLLKPIDKMELEEALGKIKKSPETNEPPKFAALVEYIANAAQNRKPKKLAVKDAQSTRFIDISNITRFQADSNYTMIFLADGSKMITTRTLKEYEDILSGSDFFRVH